MIRTIGRNGILGILVVAAVFRFGYLGFGRVLPVAWDAGRYASAAVAFISYFDHSGPKTFQDEREDRYRFKHYYEKYVQGEQIDFLYYSPPTLTRARDDLFFSGPLYPVVLSGIFFLAPVADFTFARVLGIILDLLSTWLIVLVAARLVGKRAAVAAGLLYAVYFPFILSSTMLLLETSTSFLMLSALYCLVRSAEENRRGYCYAAGVMAGLLILNKPTAMFLCVPLALGFYFYLRRELPLGKIIGRLVPFTVPVLLVFAGWVVVASIKYNQLTLRDPTYGAANLRQSTSIPFEGYDLDNVEPDFWERSIWGDISSDPIGYAGLLIKKLDRLWSRPYNDFKRSLIIPYGATETLHFLIVCVGLVGLLALAAGDFGRAAWPLLIIGYYTAVHLVFHSLSRYNVNAMPMMLIAATYVVFRVWDAFLSGDRLSRRLVLTGLALTAASWLANYEWVSGLLNIGLSRSGVVAALLVRGLLLLAALTVFGKLLLRGRGLAPKLILPVVAGLTLVAVGASSALARDHWAEWPCRLDNKTITAGTRIYISDLQKTGPGEMMAAVVDLNACPGSTGAFTVTIGGRATSFVLGEKPLVDYFYPKRVYQAYAKIIPLGIEEYRQYAIMPVPESLVVSDLSRHGYVDISVALDSNRAAEPGNCVLLYGSYRTDPSGLYMPSIRFTSIERYVFAGDPRIRCYTKVLSDSTVSHYIGDDQSANRASEDLSPAPGRQTGRYHIFLAHFRPDGSFLVY